MLTMSFDILRNDFRFDTLRHLPAFVPAQQPGGGSRNRTDDPLRAKQMLSQLSYTPDKVVGLERLELSTSRLSGVRSSHLSYRPCLRSLVKEPWLFEVKSEREFFP